MSASKLLPDKLRVFAKTLRQDASNVRRAIVGRRRPPFSARANRTATAPRSRRADDAATKTPVSVGEPERGTEVERIAVFALSGVEVVVRPEQTILEAGLEAGVDLIFSCGLGGCGACMLTCTDGQVEYDDVDATCLLPRDVSEGLCLACVGRPRGRIVLEA